jgi:hypothetical protein
MAVTCANKTNKSSAVAGTSIVTASITPSANKLLTALVCSRQSAGTTQLPTVSGDSLTWAQVATFELGGRRTTLFTAFGPSPTAGAVTADFAGVSQTTMTLQIDEFTGARFSYGNNGTDCLLNATTSTANPVGSLTITLPGFQNSGNATYGVFQQSSGATPTAGTGFTLIANATNVGGFITAVTEFQAANDTSVDVSMSVSTSRISGWAFEVVAATPPASPLLLY